MRSNQSYSITHGLYVVSTTQNSYWSTVVLRNKATLREGRTGVQDLTGGSNAKVPREYVNYTSYFDDL